MIYIAICDDNGKTVGILKNKVNIFLKDNDVLADVVVYTQSRMLQYDIEEGIHYDLILSDIEMPYIDGMALAAYIKRYLPEVLIIFITSHLKYAVDAYELSIFRYIPKNSLNTRLPHALKDAINMINIQSEKYYTIEMPSRIEKIPYHKILYIQREGKNSVITLTDNSVTKVRKSLTQIFKELKSEDFIYVDRGDIVNLAYIMGLKDGIVELKNGIRLPASHSKLNQIKARLSEFWGANMTLLYESIDLIASFIEFFVLYKIYSILFREYRRRQSRLIDILLAIGGMAIIHICNHIALFSYFTLLVFILWASISAAFFYKTNYVALFSIASFYILCLSCFDFLIVTLVSNFYGGYETFVKIISVTGGFRAIIISIVKILWIIAYFLLEKYLYRFANKTNYVYTTLIISCIGFLGFMYLADQTFKAFDYTIPGLWFVFFAMFLFIVYFVMENREEKMKLNFAEMRNALLEENYKTINKIYMSNAKLYHDLNNHLNVLYQLLDEGNGDGAKKYIKEISRPIMKLAKTVWTGTDVVDVIINSKIEKMREMNISYEINVEFPQNTNILPHDMCTILANLLDNAIEAVGAMEAPGTVELTIRRINYFLLIKVCNSCVTQKEKFVNYPSTTKENKGLHGWGLPSVKEAVDKYNGTMKCTNEGNQFVTKIMLFFEIAD